MITTQYLTDDIDSIATYIERHLENDDVFRAIDSFAEVDSEANVHVRKENGWLFVDFAWLFDIVEEDDGSYYYQQNDTLIEMIISKKTGDKPAQLQLNINERFAKKYPAMATCFENLAHDIIQKLHDFGYVISESEALGLSDIEAETLKILRRRRQKQAPVALSHIAADLASAKFYNKGSSEQLTTARISQIIKDLRDKGCDVRPY